MASVFPSEAWLNELNDILNSDTKYADLAREWEGDLLFVIQPAGNLKEPLTFYIDLWHGKCRKIDYNPVPESYPDPAFKLTASYTDITEVLTGKLNPITAMMTSKLKVKGNMGYMMRNVPMVLDFVRIAHEITGKIL